MPELPEVEIVRAQLARELRGARISSCEILLPRLVKFPTPLGYRRGVKGRKVCGVRRRGKFLLLALDGDCELVIHLGMTGSLILVPRGGERPRHTHIVYRLEDDRDLLYVDPRTFGETALVRGDDYRALPSLRRMGPEPLEEGFTPQRLAEALRGKCRVKAALLDQARLAGLGNIYADEALHRSRIHPLRRVDTLDAGEVSRLHAAIREVLAEALESGGSSVSDYVDLRGERGSFQESHRVYRRAGEPCRACGEIIRRETVSGRGTYFCPFCQK